MFYFNDLSRRCISVFLNEADFLEKSLGLIIEVLEIILSVQRQHIYLEVISIYQLTIEFYNYKFTNVLTNYLCRIYLWETTLDKKCPSRASTMIF